MDLYIYPWVLAVLGLVTGAFTIPVMLGSIGSIIDKKDTEWALGLLLSGLLTLTWMTFALTCIFG